MLLIVQLISLIGTNTRIYQANIKCSMKNSSSQKFVVNNSCLDYIHKWEEIFSLLKGNTDWWYVVPCYTTWAEGVLQEEAAGPGGTVPTGTSPALCHQAKASRTFHCATRHRNRRAFMWQNSTSEIAMLSSEAWMNVSDVERSLKKRGPLSHLWV